MCLSVYRNRQYGSGLPSNAYCWKSYWWNPVKISARGIIALRPSAVDTTMFPATLAVDPSSLGDSRTRLGGVSKKATPSLPVCVENRVPGTARTAPSRGFPFDRSFAHTRVLCWLTATYVPTSVTSSHACVFTFLNV